MQAKPISQNGRISEEMYLQDFLVEGVKQRTHIWRTQILPARALEVQLVQP